MTNKDGKLHVSADEAAHAASMWTVALIGRLVTKGVIDTDEANEIAAMAASMCRAGGSEGAASLIEIIQPSCVGVDVVAAALDRGMSVKRQAPE